MAYKKFCCFCRNWSYSATDMKEWKCPKCGNDLTDNKSYVSEKEVKAMTVKEKVQQAIKEEPILKHSGNALILKIWSESDNKDLPKASSILRIKRTLVNGK